MSKILVQWTNNGHPCRLVKGKTGVVFEHANDNAAMGEPVWRSMRDIHVDVHQLPERMEHILKDLYAAMEPAVPKTPPIDRNWHDVIMTCVQCGMKGPFKDFGPYPSGPLCINCMPF